MPCALNLFPDTVLHTDTASCQNITALRSPSLHFEPDLQRVNRLRKTCIVPDTTLPVLAYPLLRQIFNESLQQQGGAGYYCESTALRNREPVGVAIPRTKAYRAALPCFALLAALCASD